MKTKVCSVFSMEEFTCHQPEEELSSGPARSVHAAGKAPSKTKRVRVESDDDDEVPDRPNLVLLFDEYDLPDDERLALCVATAGFYRALLRKPKRK